MLPTFGQCLLDSTAEVGGHKRGDDGHRGKWGHDQIQVGLTDSLAKCDYNSSKCVGVMGMSQFVQRYHSVSS